MSQAVKNYLKIINLEEVDSTNNYAIKLATEGAEEITVITARSQTNGRGRLNRSWSSPKDKGIYVSFIFRPKNKLDDLYFLPAIMSLAVSRVLSKILAVKIKLPNDVLVKNGNIDKKIAGILVEAKSLNAVVDFVVVGIGVNVNSTEEEIPESATSLFIETKKEYDIKKLLNRLISEVLVLYSMFKKREFDAIFKELYRYQEKKIKILDSLSLDFSTKYDQVVRFL